ncbi:DENN domain-containing protein 4B [Aplysia californica]|uniref:DENN domain-containing protein 4B n=1 Tax=Aplysia californica TaxID=6500 RepID=A0ABM0ZUQ6_APLCA|nr:DENN domain-containing protein 4B [Aplysia californica]
MTYRYRQMEERRVADYFVVAGLDRQQQLPLEEFSNEAITKPSFRLDPITDVTVINRSLGEKVPKGYECIETTPTEYPANLNHGSMRWCPDMYICYRRGRDKPPLKDLGILCEGKEFVMDGCEVVQTTMAGHPANVNNSTSSRIYITYRRADKCAASDTLVVVDICVILGSRGEEPPLTFLKIPKNLNKGVVGSDVFLCYKKAMVKNDVLAYKASILDRYPLEDYSDFPLPEQVPMFCLPMGATIECWSADAQHPMPSFSTFILTGAAGEKVYGAAVGFYEEYREEDLTDLQMRSLGLKNKSIREQYRIQKTVHVRKSISLLSHWPFFDAFKKFLSQLYKVSITGPHHVPLERHISHFMYHVPYPSPERPRILVQLAHDSLSLCMPEDSPLPQSGASFITLLGNLGPDHTMSVLLFVLLESKILLHSLRPTVLTEVAEAVSTMIFPFHWQCPYIPLCPLGLSDVLNAPCPFIVGVDSRYFDLYDPPPDVICVDLDTNRLYLPEDKKSLSYKLLPKKATRVLQESLSRLFAKASLLDVKPHDSDGVSLEMTHFDIDFRRKKQTMQLELAIQEVFLRFTASILKDYKNFLNPIMKQPTIRTTDAQTLFDMQGFLKSRDKAHAKFFSQLMRTQMFFRFIEERSFVSDNDASLAFFDECSEKVDELREEPKLIEIDNTHTSERTVFIMPPEPTGLPEGIKYSYNGFPELKSELFLPKKTESLIVPAKPTCPNSPLARRTKQEVKSAQKMALQQAGDPETWSKCLLSYCYSLWFVVFPSFVQSHPKKLEALKVGFAVLRKMQEAKLLTVDELCYRVLMQLAGQYNKPGLAVQVFSQMKKHGVHPNAITYGYYNKVMLEAKWPSPQSKARLRWLKIRNVIIGVAQFRRAVRRRSLSIYSNSGSEFDRISHASADSYLGETSQAPVKAGSEGVVATGDEGSSPVVRDPTTAGDLTSKNSGSLEERMSTGGVSDRGYNSMTQEDVKRLSQMVISADDTGSASSPATSDASDTTTGKGKGEGWGPLSFFGNLTHGKERRASERVKKEVHIVEDEKHTHISNRPRVGSIVKRSRNRSSSDADEFELQKGAVLSNSCGLVMVSQVCVEHRTFSPDTDVRLQVAEAKRRRHRSAGENHSKPSRSMSLFASWRPPRNNGHADDGSVSRTQRSKLRYSDLMKTEEDDNSIIGSPLSSEQCVGADSVDGVPSNFPASISSVEPVTNCVLSDLDTGSTSLQETEQSSQTVVVKTSSHTVPNSCEEEDSNNKLFLDSDPLSGESTTDHLCGANAEHSSDSVGNPESDSSHNVPTEQRSNNSSVPSTPAAASSLPISEEELEKPTESQTVSGQSADLAVDNNPSTPLLRHSRENSTSDTTSRREMRRSVSISEDRLSGQFNEVVPMKQSLSETGRTLSSPGCDLPVEPRTPQKAPAEDTQSVSSLTDSKRERSSDFMLKRTPSLKKTNEAIGSFLKFASRAAYNKLSELKQTISSPMRNGSLGSLGSLTQSIEELDCNDGSSTSGTIRDRPRHAGSQDLLSHSEESEAEDTDKRLSGLSFESAPSPSYLDGYSGQREGFTGSFPHIGEQLGQELLKVAMEVEMSSCSRCTKCNRLIYDEEIMAGWSAEDSNLNTSCPYCHNKFVPHLQIYIKDWRGDKKSVVFSGDMGTTPQEKLLASSGPMDASQSSKVDFQIGDDGSPVAEPEHSSLEKGEMPLSLEEAAGTMRRRCTSECLTQAIDNISLGSAIDSPTRHAPLRSPLSLSTEEEEFESEHGCKSNPYESRCVTKEFMSRSASSREPQVVAYLSPLVLRKEVEYVLDHEGNLCLAQDAFVEEHPIIFWNLVWFFRRIEVPTHLTGFLLTSQAFSCNKLEDVNKLKGTYTNKNILIVPQWDNIRIHDEVGLPMYSAWRAGHKSTVIDALVIESDSFSRPLMWQIIAAIQRNDVLAAIRLVAHARRRMGSRKRRFRSMYREILFLSFAQCGRENIDHDAFDREYATAFKEKLKPGEVNRLQKDDHPKSLIVQFCRQVFSELEV